MWITKMLVYIMHRQKRKNEDLGGLLPKDAARSFLGEQSEPDEIPLQLIDGDERKLAKARFQPKDMEARGVISFLKLSSTHWRRWSKGMTMSISRVSYRVDQV